jgi:hypothetical protein
MGSAALTVTLAARRLAIVASLSFITRVAASVELAEA